MKQLHWVAALRCRRAKTCPQAGYIFWECGMSAVFSSEDSARLAPASVWLGCGRFSLLCAGAHYHLCQRTLLSCGSTWISCESFCLANIRFTNDPGRLLIRLGLTLIRCIRSHFESAALAHTVKCWQSVNDKACIDLERWQGDKVLGCQWLPCHNTFTCHWVIYLSSKNLCHLEFPSTLCTEQGVLWHHGDGETSAATGPWRCVQVEQWRRWTEMDWDGESVLVSRCCHWLLVWHLSWYVLISWNIMKSVGICGAEARCHTDWRLGAGLLRILVWERQWRSQCLAVFLRQDKIRTEAFLIMTCLFTSLFSFLTSSFLWRTFAP